MNPTLELNSKINVWTLEARIQSAAHAGILPKKIADLYGILISDALGFPYAESPEINPQRWLEENSARDLQLFNIALVIAARRTRQRKYALMIADNKMSQVYKSHEWIQAGNVHAIVVADKAKALEWRHLYKMYLEEMPRDSKNLLDKVQPTNLSPFYKINPLFPKWLTIWRAGFTTTPPNL